MILVSYLGKEVDTLGRDSITFQELQFLFGIRGARKAIDFGYVDSDLSVKSVQDYIELNGEFLENHEYLSFSVAQRLIGVSTPMFNYYITTRFIRSRISPLDLRKEYFTEDLLALRAELTAEEVALVNA